MTQALPQPHPGLDEMRDIQILSGRDWVVWENHVLIVGPMAVGDGHLCLGRVKRSIAPRLALYSGESTYIASLSCQ